MTQNHSRLHMESDAIEAERRAHEMGRAHEEGLPPIVSSLTDPCEEAAALYAVGRHKDAANVLTSELNNKKGICPPNLWYMLMDIYQATGQQGAFEKLAMFFAKVFNTSPPSWEDTAVAQTGFGRNVMIVEGSAKDVPAEKVKDFIEAAKNFRQARLDLSRARLDGTPEDAMASVVRLLDILPKIRKQRVPIFLMGETQMMSDLRTRLRGGEGDQDPLWLLLFELMQWRGLEDEFEDIAVEYAQRFDRCAPGYELGGAVAVAPEKSAPVDASKWTARGDTLVPPPVISAGDAEMLTEKVEVLLARHGSVKIDASNVRLFEYEAASAFGQFLGASSPSSEKVLILRPSELVRVLLKIVGADPFVSFQPRRR